MPNRTFTPDQLEGIGVPFEIDISGEPGYATELHREQVDTRRWVSVHQLIFRAPDDGKAWAVCYEQGLTEHQDAHDPWGYQSEIVASEMEQHEVTVTQWRAVPE